MTKWIRSERYSKKNHPVYFHSSYKYALIKEKYPLDHWCLVDCSGKYFQWDYLEHFLSNVTFNDAKRWFEFSKYNPDNTNNEIKEV